MNLIERSRPQNFKPLIDKSIEKIAAWAGVDTKKIQSVLSLLSAQRYSGFEYLYNAMRKVKPLIFIEKVEIRLTFGWSKHLFNNPEQEHIYVGETIYDYDEADLESEQYAIVLEDYPKDAHAALKQNTFWGGSGAEVAGVWTNREGVETIYVASPKKFEILAVDAVDFIEKIIEKSFKDSPLTNIPASLANLLASLGEPDEEDEDDDDEEAEELLLGFDDEDEEDEDKEDEEEDENSETLEED
jgi:hypothetical protein